MNVNNSNTYLIGSKDPIGNNIFISQCGRQASGDSRDMLFTGDRETALHRFNETAYKLRTECNIASGEEVPLGLFQVSSDGRVELIDSRIYDSYNTSMFRGDPQFKSATPWIHTMVNPVEVSDHYSSYTDVMMDE